MDTESEPYVRLATLRQLHQVVADLTTARSLADTLQAVADGVVVGLGYELAAVNLVRPDGDLIVAAIAGDHEAATRVELVLPESGVCGGAGLFDGQPTEANGGACCGPSAEPELVALGVGPVEATSAGGCGSGCS